jgi:hypothetical protein
VVAEKSGKSSDIGIVENVAKSGRGTKAGGKSRLVY